jgi:hypothetical protein
MLGYQRFDRIEFGVFWLVAWRWVARASKFPIRGKRVTSLDLMASTDG